LLLIPTSPDAKSIFGHALALDVPEERSAYLAQACAGSPGLRAEIEELLRVLDQAGGFLLRPAGTDSNQTKDFEPSPHDVGSSIGSYKLLEKIGEGGMGEVWVVDQQQPIKRRVALKLIKPGMDSRSVLGRFEAERQALAVMDHPNIAKVLDAGTTTDGRPYFVMELVKGTPITEFCDARKLTPKERLELFVPVCQAIQHAHMKGIIHRDIKPSNVLVELHDDRALVKVIDFGVAKAVGQKLTDKTIYTGFGALVGTPSYMAPEQATFNALDIDTRADVYALGVLLYELLAGSPPIEKERLNKAALDEVLRIVRDEEPPRPSQRLSTSQAKASIAATRGSEPTRLSALMKGEIDWIVMKALEKDRTRRYETANGLAKDLQRYLKGEAVEACPPTLGYQFMKAYRRNRAAVLVGVAFVALIALAGIAAGFLAVRAEEARKGEMAERKKAEEREAEANEQQARAEREQKRAEEEKRASEAVRAFLQDDLLRQADVRSQASSLSRTGGDFDIKPNPTIDELLDRAAVHLTPEQIEAKFPNLPFVQAEVLHAVANAYAGMGKFDRAMALTDRAVPLYLATRGPDDRATLAARASQALHHATLDGRLDVEGERMLAAVAEDCRRVFGPRDRMGFDANIWFGRSIALRNSPEAIPFFAKLKADGMEFYGADDNITIIAAGHLAMAYRLAGRIPEAIREMEQVLATVKAAKIRPDYPWFYAGFAELAEAYKATNHKDKAIEVYRELLALWERRGEPYHRNTWIPRHDFAWLVAGSGDTEGAAKLFEANLQAAPNSEWAFLSFNGAQEMMKRLGRDDAALDFARKGLAAILAGQPPTHRSWYTGMARRYVGQLLVARKEHAEAEPLLVAAVADLTEFDDKRPDYDSGKQMAAAHKALAQLYADTARPAEAARVQADHAKFLLRRTAKGSAGNVPNGSAWEVYNSGDHATAAKMFEVMEKSANSPEDKCAAYHGLFLSEQKLGKLDDARKHAQAAVDVIVKARGPDHRSYKLGMAQSALGVLLFELKEPVAAEPHLIAGCRLVADYAHQIPSHDFPHRYVAFDHLIQILEQSNRIPDAKTWSAVWQELFGKLLRRSLAGDKLTAATVTLVNQQVLAHAFAGRHDDALALYREVNIKHPPDRKPTAEAWLRLIGTVFNHYEGKLQAERMKPWAELRIPPLERDLDALRKTKPAEVPLLRATNTLLFSYVHAGRKADVVKLVEEVIARQKANGWRTDADAVASYGSTTKVVALAGRPDLASELSSAVLAAVTKAKATSEVLATATYSHGLSRSVAGAHTEAEGHFREAVRLQSSMDAKHWKAAKYQAWLGFALHDQKKYAEAEKVLTEAYTEWEVCVATAPAWEKQHTLLIAGRLASLYEAIKKPDEAAKWKVLSVIK
jgi:eukaryotic-like serine/threonine-protein kinase